MKSKLVYALQCFLFGGGGGGSTKGEQEIYM